MAKIPTITFGGSNTVGRFTGFFNETAVPGYTINPNDLSDIPFHSAALEIGCPCDVPENNYGILECASTIDKSNTILLHSKKLKRFAPIDISNECKYFPVDSGYSTINYYHIKEDLLASQSSQTKTDPQKDHSRINLRDIQNNLNEINNIGYQKILGDNPGISNGIPINLIDSKISLNLLSKDVINSLDAKFEIKTDNNQKYVEITDISGIYIKEIILFVKPNANLDCNVLFKYNIEENECGINNYRISKIINQETLIDNIRLNPLNNDQTSENKNPKEQLLNIQNSGSYIPIECGYATGDVIQIWGKFPQINKIQINFVYSTDYIDNLIKSENFSTCFDSRNNLYVFFEENINYTELPYNSYECVKPSSSSSSIIDNFPSSSSSTSGSGGGGIGGGGGGGGAGIGGGGGAGGGGIPGNAAQPVTYDPPIDSSSSSSSSTTIISSSSSASSAPADTTPPAPPQDGVGTVQINTEEKAVVYLTWEDGANDSSDTAKYNIYRSNNLEGPYVLIGSSVLNNFTDNNPVENTWNYYRITAVDAAGNESAYTLIRIFVVRPKQCENPDCAGCGSRYLQNSYKVFFADFSAEQLTFNCTSCNDNESYIRILGDDAFYESERDLNGNRVPIKFCLLKSCDDTNISQQCKWTGTFDIPAIVNNCKGISCFNNKLDKTFIPLTINLIQNRLEGWKLEAYCISPDCRKMPLFESDWSLTACQRPVVFVNIIDLDETKASGTNNVLRSTSNCGLYLPDDYTKDTGTISALVSPDLGKTWYYHHGIVHIYNNRKAVKPKVIYDNKNDNIHLFYIEKDIVQTGTALELAATTGFDAFMVHVKIPVELFKNEDSYKTFYPAPISNNEYIDPVIYYSTANNLPLISDYAKESLKQFSTYGQSLRLLDKNVLFYETRFGSDQSALDYIKTAPSITYKNENGEYVETGRRLDMLVETFSPYISDNGQLCLLRSGISNTLIDPPERLTRRRRKKAQCGEYVWSVSGITDTNCSCQKLLGTFPLELNSRTSNYEDYIWTLTVSSDYKYWEVYTDEPGGGSQGFMTFRKKRGLDLCPPTGIYETVCNKCLGNIIGSLDSKKIGVYADNVFIDSSAELPASEINKTDFSYTVLGTSKSQTFVMKNTTDDIAILSGNPKISITGKNADEFKLTNSNFTKVDPRDGKGFEFTITFTPNSVNCKSDSENTRDAQVRIPIEHPDYDTYIFNISGKCIVYDYNDPQSVNLVNREVASGVVYAADSVGRIYHSTNMGSTWENYTLGIKSGQNSVAIYENNTNALYNIYVSDNMLFIRRYPAIFRTQTDDPNSDLAEAFDGYNLIKEPETLIPNTDVFQFGVPTTVAEFLSYPIFFGLPNVNIPGEILDTFEEDLRSKRTQIINEMDIRGIPMFLVGYKQGSLINCYFPYTNDFLFNDGLFVSDIKPTAYIGANGIIRFFYIDSNGNINGGSISGGTVILDTKLINQ